MMKSVLLHIYRDAGQDARLAAAIDIVRNSGGRLICLQSTPWSSYVYAGDLLGVAYLPPEAFQSFREAQEEDRNLIEGRLQREGVEWEWRHEEGSAAQLIAEHANLADLVILSQPKPGESGLGRRAPLAADVAVHIQTPSLVVPSDNKRFASEGAAIVAWNGSPEAGHAVRLALPLLRMASEIHIIGVTGEKETSAPDELVQYLRLHGPETKTHAVPHDETSVADTLVKAASKLDAAYIVLGAYGHSRFRETVFGGVTQEIILHSPIPLVLAH
ncbi:universal stress protein [Aurantiacibacter atlanticus]|nr:universal stress protein [Aurantiacibacter atlanticus]